MQRMVSLVLDSMYTLAVHYNHIVRLTLGEKSMTSPLKHLKWEEKK